MTKGILLVTMIYLAAIADSVFAPLLAVGEVMPDFLAIAALILTFVVRGTGGILIAAAVGGLADLNLPGRCGVGVATFGLVAFVICTTRLKTVRRPLARAALTFPAVATMSLCIALLRGLLKELDWSPGGYLLVGVGAGFYTALVGLPFYCLVDRFAHRQAHTF
jgi:rod shape-determining protein MreD